MFNPVIVSAELVGMFGGVSYDDALLPADRHHRGDEDEGLDIGAWEAQERFFRNQLREVEAQMKAATDPVEQAALWNLYSDLYKDRYGVRPR